MSSRQATSTYAKVAGPAVRKVTDAVKAGRLVRPDVCSDCGTSGKTQGHHHNGYDASHALDVVWLCRPCHLKRHDRHTLPSWERGARAYAEATGRTGPGEWRYHTFADRSMPKHLFTTMRRLWAALRTDEERTAMLAVIDELQREETAA